MWKLGLRPRYSFPGNFCFEISVFGLCSAVSLSIYDTLLQAADFSEESKMAAAMGLSRPEKRGVAARNNWYSPRGTRAGTGNRMLERGRRDLDEEEFPRNLRSVFRYLVILNLQKNSKKSTM